MQDAVAPSKISLGVTYSCYGPVDILPVQQVASVHRCTVPATIPVVNDRQDYIFREEDCTNGLPSGDCDGMLSKRAQVLFANFFVSPPVVLNFCVSVCRSVGLSKILRYLPQVKALQR
eukprot:m.20489 g.20489  ORF g.20489 m.20489 type:complete len:118 (-) comp3839_c0_seq1:424-777(-)